MSSAPVPNESPTVDMKAFEKRLRHERLTQALGEWLMVAGALALMSVLFS